MTLTTGQETMEALQQENDLLRQRVAELEQQAQRDFHMSNARVQNLIDHIGAAIFIHHNGQPRFVNPLVTDILGYTSQELNTLKFADFIHPDSLALVEERSAARQRGESVPERYEIKVITKTGETHWIEIHNSPIVFMGEPSILVTFFDITERKETERAFYDQKEQYRSLVESIDDWLWEVNADSVYTYSSPAVKEILGYTPEEILGKTPFDFMLPDEAQRVGAVFQEIAVQQTPMRRFENRMQHKDGHEVILETNGVPFFDANGTMRGYRGIDHDVTQQRHIEAERANLQQHIIEAQQHTLRELSTPLIPISNKVVIMPLIGTIDSGRAQQIMDALLEGVARQQAELAILDITGVTTVDTQVVQALVSAAQAVRLLGAKVMLTGIHPQIAQTLVYLGVDLSGIATQSSLQAGIAEALKQ